MMRLDNGSEVIGTLISVRRGKVVIEARRRFEIPVDEAPRSLRSAVGMKVGILLIDGQMRWRFLRTSREAVASRSAGRKRRSER